jgi:hypothetical protein
VPRHLRLKLFYQFMHPYAARKRRQRSQWFVDVMNIQRNMNIIDLGGSPTIWEHISVPLNITLVNIQYEDNDRLHAERIRQHKFQFIQGDACRVKFQSNSFDLAFSNSVIEHVGDEHKRAAFAGEIRRLAARYWVQTPSKYFPIEAHTGMPFWWYYPEGLRSTLKQKWSETIPEWTKMIEGTTVLEWQELQRLLPESRILTERTFGIAKSYIAYKV